jgi:hypothetical protein
MTRTDKWYNKFSSHGTHLPILDEVNKRFSNIKTIVEIGSGLISTRFFLNEFTNLKRLISYETNEKWYEEMKVKVKDKRHIYKLVSSKDKGISKLEDADLLFVDGIKGHRMYALNNYSNKYDLVVWHDCRMGKVVRVTNVKRDYKYRFEYIPKIDRPNSARDWPPTMVLSNKIRVDKIKWKCEWTLKWKEIVIENYMKR